MVFSFASSFIENTDLLTEGAETGAVPGAEAFAMLSFLLQDQDVDQKIRGPLGSTPLHMLAKVGCYALHLLTSVIALFDLGSNS